MTDQIIDALMARSIQKDVARTQSLLAWVVMRDEGIVTLTYVGRREDLCGRFGSIMQHVERMSPAAKF